MDQYQPLPPVLQETSPSVINWQDYEGRTAIHFAVAVENSAVVEFLLNFQLEPCEVDRLDNTFRTPLHWAAQLGKLFWFCLKMSHTDGILN